MTTLRTAIILAGGEVREEIQVPPGAAVICADCGYRHALAQGIVPDAVVGDLDSWTQPLPAHVTVLQHPPEKDDTDTWLAILHGRALGCRHFVIYGAFGGARIDHAVANVQLLRRMAETGLHGELVYGEQRVFLWMPEDGVLRLRDGGMFSLFSLTETCTGVCVRGAKYPLKNAVLRQSYPIGVSNERTEDPAEITLQSGVLLVVTDAQKSG